MLVPSSSTTPRRLEALVLASPLAPHVLHVIRHAALSTVSYAGHCHSDLHANIRACSSDEMERRCITCKGSSFVRDQELAQGASRVGGRRLQTQWT